MEKDIRESIRTNFDAGWRVNGEQSGKTKILYVLRKVWVKQIREPL